MTARVVLTARIDPGQHAALAAAAREGETLSDVVRRLLSIALQSMEVK